ncbi:hypothetical protein SprV_0802541700 [Sparganum proliferum]
MTRYKVDIAALSETRSSEEGQLDEGKQIRHHHRRLRPSMASSDEAKNQSYEDLCVLLASLPKADKVIGLADSSVHVGADHAAWRGGLGPHVLGGSNDNGLLHPKNLRRALPHPDQHFPPPSDSGEGDLDSPRSRH